MFTQVLTVVTSGQWNSGDSYLYLDAFLYCDFLQRTCIFFIIRRKQLSYFKNNFTGKITYGDWCVCLPNSPYAKIFCQVIWGTLSLLPSIPRAQRTPE